MSRVLVTTMKNKCVLTPDGRHFVGYTASRAELLGRLFA
jgi:hypothetical protein